MVEATRRSFDTIYSIELDQTLYRGAKEKFAPLHHISILQGDSTEALPTLLERISEPALFWLDAHYSGGITARGPKETPIIDEIQNIFNHPIKHHVILIDDARSFTGGTYPTLAWLRDLTSRQQPQRIFTVADDIIRILPLAQ